MIDKKSNIKNNTMKTSLRENVLKSIFIQKGRFLLLFFLLAVVNVCAFAQSIDASLREEMGRRSDDEKIGVTGALMWSMS